MRETAQRTLQQGHLGGGAGTASARALRVVCRCRRCVSFWLWSPWSVWVGDDVWPEGILVSAVEVSTAESAVWSGSLASGWGCVGRLVGELRPVGVGMGCPEALGVGCAEGAL